MLKKIDAKTAKTYIIKNHYSHGCHHSPFPCYGLFDNNYLIGVLMFATPCSEAVRASIFGKEYKDNIIELHRLHILDVTPKNTESWFIAQCIRLLKIDRPQTWAIISFADSTEGHCGTIYKATNFMYCGKTNQLTFYLDENGRLHHPRQCGVNINKEMAINKNWKPVKRNTKYRYVKILGNKTEIKNRLKLLKLKGEKYEN